MCDSNSLFPLCSSKSFCAGARRAEGGLLHGRRHPTNYHSCHCPRGLTGKEHLPSSSLDPCFSQTLSFSLTTCCEMARRSGAWRQRRRDIYLQKNHKQTDGGEGPVCRKGWWDQKQSDIAVHKGLEGINFTWIWAEGRCHCFAGLSQQLSAFPWDCVCDEGVGKQPHLIGSRDSQLAGREQGDPSRRWRGSPHKQDTHSCVEAAIGEAKQLLHTHIPKGLPVNHVPESEFIVPDVWSSWIKD